MDRMGSTVSPNIMARTSLTQNQTTIVNVSTGRASVEAIFDVFIYLDVLNLASRARTNGTK